MKFLLFNIENYEKQRDTEVALYTLWLCTSVTLCLDKRFVETDPANAGALKAYSFN